MDQPIIVDQTYLSYCFSSSTVYIGSLFPTVLRLMFLASGGALAQSASSEGSQEFIYSKSGKSTLVTHYAAH